VSILEENREGRQDGERGRGWWIKKKPRKRSMRTKCFGEKIMRRKEAKKQEADQCERSSEAEGEGKKERRKRRRKKRRRQKR
jgi:hypothetical protein